MPLLESLNSLFLCVLVNVVYLDSFSIHNHASTKSHVVTLFSRAFFFLCALVNVVYLDSFSNHIPTRHN